MKKTICIVGAKSDISIALANKYASEGYDLQLVGRNFSELKSISNDLKIRYEVNVKVVELDILKYNMFSDFVKNLAPLPDTILCAVGILGIQKEDQEKLENSSINIKTNFEGPALLLGEFANHFEKRKSGTIIGISSVAGERGRGSNYIYGSAKAGFTQYLSGMRSRLSSSNVRVITVIPGFVYTKMTNHLKLNRFLAAKPNEVAKAIYKADLTKKNIIYIKPIWKLIMFVIKILPEFVFKKIKF